MKTLREKFDEFHSANPRIYNLFERFTIDVIRSGRRTFGAKAIMERIRWNVNIETAGDEFKINNNHTAFYVRMFEDRHPEYRRIFKTRMAAADYIGSII